MAGKVLEVCDLLTPDRMASEIARYWQEWDNFRSQWKSEVQEVQSYIFATDTTKTTNRKLPWKNKTTIPKLCQTRDNLYSNYSASLFPQRKWLIWEANTEDSNSKDKRDSIENYMQYVMTQRNFKDEMDKLILDYIDTGNCFVMPEWIDQRVEVTDPSGTTRLQVGYVGPGLRRINPFDIVFNPTAESFERSPKIIRSIVSLGEVKEIIESQATDENKEDYRALWKYLQDIRTGVANYTGDVSVKDPLFNIDGFGSFTQYLASNYVEILTFYGDMYDFENDKFLKNHQIMIVDRHKVISKKPNPSFFGYAPIFHVSWRKRQDNLWGMGPLANLVGIQYRVDHLENLKADIYDLTAFPVIMVKGAPEDFTWQPNEKIYIGDEGDVKMIVPDVQALQANLEIQNLLNLMEEMAGAPKEAMGFRTPGEKTKYEVQRLENAAARVFENKIKQFEEQLVEPCLNAQLELARRNIDSAFSIPVFDNEFKMQTFMELSVSDITGSGRIRPVAARHFAEQSQLIQNLTNLAGSGLFQLVQPHMSGVNTAFMLEDLFNMKDYQLITPYIGITEQAQAQAHANISHEQATMASTTPAGIAPDDIPTNVQGLDQTPQGQ